MLPMQGVQVRSLVRELRSHMPDSVAKKKKKFFLIKKKRERDGINIVYMFAVLFPQEIEHLMKQVTKCQFIFSKLQFH